MESLQSSSSNSSSEGPNHPKDLNDEQQKVVDKVYVIYPYARILKRFIEQNYLVNVDNQILYFYGELSNFVDTNTDCLVDWNIPNQLIPIYYLLIFIGLLTASEVDFNDIPFKTIIHQVGLDQELTDFHFWLALHKTEYFALSYLKLRDLYSILPYLIIPISDRCILAWGPGSLQGG